MYFELIFQYKIYQGLLFCIWKPNCSSVIWKKQHCSFSIELPLTFVKNLLNIYVKIYFWTSWLFIVINLPAAAAAAAKSLQLCPTLCDPRDGSLPGSSVPGILQAKFAYLCQYYNDLTTGALK